MGNTIFHSVISAVMLAFEAYGIVRSLIFVAFVALVGIEFMYSAQLHDFIMKIWGHSRPKNQRPQPTPLQD